MMLSFRRISALAHSRRRRLDPAPPGHMGSPSLFWHDHLPILGRWTDRDDRLLFVLRAPLGRTLVRHPAKIHALQVEE